MLKQKYFLADIFILSAEKQPIKLSWRKIEWLLFMLIAHWWGMTAAITVIAIECVLALWTVYEMRHASDEPVDE